MTLVSNAFTSYSAKGIREDLSDFIYNIDPTDTPFMSNAGRGKITNTLFEWQTDTLDSAVTTNQQLEGDSVSGAVTPAITASARIGNYAEIAYKTFAVTGTEEVVNKAGRKSEKAYQMAKKAASLKRDMESSLLANKGANAGSATVARATGGMGAIVKTNVNKASDGTNPSWTTTPNTARTDGTARALTETIAKDVIQQCWTSGAKITTIMLGATEKQTFSSFSGVATRFAQVQGQEQAGIIGAADVYVSDFGVLRAVPNRFQRAKDGWFLDFDFISVDYLQPFKTIELAKLGDADQTQILAEYGLRVKNEKALGLAADLS